MVSYITDMIVHFKKSSLGQEQIKSELLTYELGSKETLEATGKTKRRTEGMRRRIGYALGKRFLCSRCVSMEGLCVMVQPQVWLCRGHVRLRDS